MRDAIPIDRALISLSDKSFLLPLVSRLYEVTPSLEVLSTGGTYKVISGEKRTPEQSCYPCFPVKEVSVYTGFPESPDGLVKTLHPRVHGGILLNPEVPTHAQYMLENDRIQIMPIGLVAFNFYPFSQMVQRGDKLEKLRAHGIDIGGPGAVRSAAKSFPHVAVVTDPESFELFMKDFEREGTTTLATRFELAQRAFDLVETYDRQIAQYLRTLDPNAVAKYYRSLDVSRLSDEIK